MNFSSGMEVSAANDGLYINGVLFMYDFSPCWNCDLHSAVSSSFEPGRLSDTQFLQACLSALMPISGFADVLIQNGALWKSSPAAREAAKILSLCYNDLISRDWASAAECAINLVGLGEGLTPSGDDFLCGMLAACYIIDSDSARCLRFALIAKLSENLFKTNDISAAFLRCSMEGQFGQAIIKLACGADKQTVVQSFSAIGHSSGADTLSGLVFVAEAMRCIETGGQ